MNSLKSNKGVTLVELMVTIVIGSLVTLAVLSLFLMGLRFHRKTSDTALRQNEIQVAITLMENLVRENPVVAIEENTVKTTDDETLLYYDAADKALRTGADVTILEDVAGFGAMLEGTLLTFRVEVDDGETYEFSVYCPLTSTASSPDEDAVLFSAQREPDPEALLAQTMEDTAVPYSVRQFLKTLSSQLGSTGRIQTPEGEGEYYSQWYIGSYEDNPGWSADTPWCACFISWALEENSHLISGGAMRFANVDAFWAEFVTEDCWKTENPETGDIIFFDWIADGKADPQHVGVVVTVSGEWVYTLEGNTEGAVALRKYLVDDTRILGYGSLNWR